MRKTDRTRAASVAVTPRRGRTRRVSMGGLRVRAGNAEWGAWSEDSAGVPWFSTPRSPFRAPRWASPRGHGGVHREPVVHQHLPGDRVAHLARVDQTQVHPPDLRPAARLDG